MNGLGVFFLLQTQGLSCWCNPRVVLRVAPGEGRTVCAAAVCPWQRQETSTLTVSREIAHESNSRACMCCCSLMFQESFLCQLIYVLTTWSKKKCHQLCVAVAALLCAGSSHGSKAHTCLVGCSYTCVLLIHGAKGSFPRVLCCWDTPDVDVVPERFPGRVLLLQQILSVISSFIQKREEGTVPTGQSQDGGFYMSSLGGSYACSQVFS